MSALPNSENYDGLGLADQIAATRPWKDQLPRLDASSARQSEITCRTRNASNAAITPNARFGIQSA
jgi:hypothetical protein